MARVYGGTYPAIQQPASILEQLRQHRQFLSHHLPEKAKKKGTERNQKKGYWHNQRFLGTSKNSNCGTPALATFDHTSIRYKNLGCEPCLRRGLPSSLWSSRFHSSQFSVRFVCALQESLHTVASCGLPLETTPGIQQQAPAAADHPSPSLLQACTHETRIHNRNHIHALTYSLKHPVSLFLPPPPQAYSASHISRALFFRANPCRK
ncbi:hypothetical protein QBC35DRAFT_282492 [Podospora australis]|uniref:Uncharacterized protein n=1 Tax=Podospora australis TaxID=1536484 RepID=A0AAN6WPW7_9PEZI|nr:hypothetical protein QBC35DRAFT_282492 [Podospora australis]